MSWFHNEKLSKCVNRKLRTIKNWPVWLLYLQHYFLLKAELIGVGSLSENKNYRLKKSFSFIINKTAVRLTIHQNSASSKALLGKFWFASWQLPVNDFVNIYSWVPNNHPPPSPSIVNFSIFFPPRTSLFQPPLLLIFSHFHHSPSKRKSTITMN